MQDLLYLLLLFPILWPLVARVLFRHTVTWQEMGLNIGIVVVCVCAVWFGSISAQTHAVEIRNGEITSKARNRVSCEHSYRCNCRTYSCGEGGRDTCETCDTCYEHTHDYNWDVYTNVGNFRIPRIDRQGRHEPPRWTQIEPGQPAAREHAYTNYVQAVPDSLFNRSYLTLEGLPPVPDYPRVYDFHRADRVITVGVDLPDLRAWNDDLAERLRRLGPNRQANVIVIIAKTADPQYRHKVEAAWIGGNKNDVVVFLGVADHGNHLDIVWADVMTFALNTGNELLQVQLRDALVDLHVLHRGRVLALVDQHVMDGYIRPQMSDFEYLRQSIQPPVWVIYLTALLSVFGSIGLTWFFHNYEVDLFGKGRKIRHRNDANRWRR
jgi:hypothetical protein